MRIIKDNRFVRGFWSLSKTFFGQDRDKFGYIADNVILPLPCR